MAKKIKKLQTFKIVVPAVDESTIKKAKAIARRYAEDSDEYLVAATFLELCEALDTLNADLAKAQQEWEMKRKLLGDLLE